MKFSALNKQLFRFWHKTDFLALLLLLLLALFGLLNLKEKPLRVRQHDVFSPTSNVVISRLSQNPKLGIDKNLLAIEHEVGFENGERMPTTIRVHTKPKV
jgi:hypothetical protein